MRLAVVVLLASCGRVGFAPVEDDALDTAAASCWPQWRDGPVLAPPILVDVARSPGTNSNNPSLSRDGLTLYWISARTGDERFYRATRATTADAFVLLGEDLSLGIGDAGSIQLLPDNRAAYVTARTTGAGNFAPLYAARAAAGEPWSLVAPPLAALDSIGDEYDAFVTDDQLHLYFGRLIDMNNTDLMVAARNSVAEPFTTAEVLPGFADPTFLEADPYLSPDELTLVLTSIREDFTRRIYVATRTSTTEPFGAPVLVAPAFGESQSDIALSADACTLYFAAGVEGIQVIYETQVLQP